MKWFSDLETQKMFKSNNYRLISQSWGFQLKKTSLDPQITLMLLCTFVGLLLVVSLQILSWKLGLFSVVVLGFALMNYFRRDPFSLSFNDKENRIKLDSKKVFTKSDRPDLVVNYESRSATVSAFQEGNQNHDYKFLLKFRNQSEVPLFTLSFRKQMDDQIQEIVAEFSKLGIWNKRQRELG